MIEFCKNFFLSVLDEFESKYKKADEVNDIREILDVLDHELSLETLEHAQKLLDTLCAKYKEIKLLISIYNENNIHDLSPIQILSMQLRFAAFEIFIKLYNEISEKQ